MPVKSSNVPKKDEDEDFVQASKKQKKFDEKAVNVKMEPTTMPGISPEFAAMKRLELQKRIESKNLQIPSSSTQDFEAVYLTDGQRLPGMMPGFSDKPRILPEFLKTECPLPIQEVSVQVSLSIPESGSFEFSCSFLSHGDAQTQIVSGPNYER